MPFRPAKQILPWFEPTSATYRRRRRSLLLLKRLHYLLQRRGLRSVTSQTSNKLSSELSERRPTGRSFGRCRRKYDLSRARVTFKDIPLSEARGAFESKQVRAMLIVVPLAEKYLAPLRSVSREYERGACAR